MPSCGPHARSSPADATRDIVLVRENLEELYVASEHYLAPSATTRTRWRSPRASTRAPNAAASPNSPSTTPSGASAARSSGRPRSRGANIDPNAAIFEAVHGSAPEIAGKGIANPLALLLAACMMLDHVGKTTMADKIRRAVDRTLRDDNVRTRDLGGNATSRDLTKAVIARLTR